jgi:amino acid transporter
MACLWAFEGWADLSFLSEELINYEKNVGPLCVSAILIVSICFLIINVSYFIVLDKHQIVHSDAVAIDFGQEVSSSGNSILPYYLLISVALSAAGAANSLIITGGRAFYAIAQSNQAPPMMGRLNYAGVPAVSLVAQGTWAIVLVLLPGSSFQTLLQYMGPASWLFYALTCCAVIRLRVTEPKLHRPYRVPLYPLPPLIIVGVAFYLLSNTLSKEPFFCFLSLGFIALSLPAWWLIQRFHIFPDEDQEAGIGDRGSINHSLLIHSHNPRTLSNGFF